ncbi:glycosyltransferase [Amycolatopsis sp. NPDC004368]
MADAVAKVTDGRYRERNLTPVEPRWLLDQFPPALHTSGWMPPGNRIALRAEPYREPGRPPVTATVAKKRPVALVTFTGFTPLAELLDDADVVVGTGSAGTSLGALNRGVPLVLVPLGADHAIVAERVVAAGAALSLQGGATDPDLVAKAVAAVLADSRFRTQAERVAEEIAASQAPAEVATLIEKDLS